MIYEFRTYEATPGNLPALNKHLEVAAGLFKKHGLGVMGFWTEEVGTGGQVNYMWVYEDPRGEAEEAGELRVGPRLEETGGRGDGTAWCRRGQDPQHHVAAHSLLPRGQDRWQRSRAAHLRGDAR